MGRFFPFRRPQRGMPISLRGLARGLAKLDDALSGISIENGIVEWSANDVPHLVFGDDGAGSSPEFIRNAKEIVCDGLPDAPPDPDTPPCGHPGNEPGAGGESDGGDDTEHPGDHPGAGGDTEHPGDSPSPPSSGECP